MKLQESLSLPCGVVLSNRFVKSAMSEILATQDHGPSPQLIEVYKRWVKGDCGLLMTGNVMIDSRALGEPKNVVIEDERHLDDLKKWAEVGSSKNQIWVQLNHPGKQSPSFLSPEPVAPSAIALEGPLKYSFRTPRALTSQEIKELIRRFAYAAKIVQKSGFQGVQIHAAHGYLISQFLSPKHNQRDDEWGGSLKNRMRFIMEVYRAIREQVGKHFPVGIKLNVSDFQRGGFTEQESLLVIEALANEGIDLVEISGGSYEKPIMMGPMKDLTSDAREAYFSEFSASIRKTIRVPLVLTGGFRRAIAMEACLEEGVCDLIGLARPIALDPDLPRKILAGDLQYKSLVRRISTGIKKLDALGMLNITWYEQQIALLGNGKEPKANLNPYLSILKTFASLGLLAFRPRRA